MTLPINRTNLSAYQTNANPQTVFASTVAKNTMTDVFNGIDELNTKVDSTLQGIYDSGKFSQLGIINVKDAPFNAKGDGLADDTAAVQSALNAGGVVFFPSGSYKATHLNIPDNTVVLGASRDKASLRLATDNPNDILLYVTGGNVSIKNLTLLGPKSPQGNTGIDIERNKDNIHIDNCIIDGFNTSILFIGNNKNIKVTDCAIRNCQLVTGDDGSGYGIIMQACQNTLIERNIFENTVYRHQIYLSIDIGNLTLESKNHVICHNSFYGRTDGTASHKTAYEILIKVMSSKDVRIHHNLVDGGIGAFMITNYLDNDPNLRIRNLTIDHNIIKNLNAVGQDNAVFTFLNRQSYMHDVIVNDNIAANCACKGIIGCNFQNANFHDNDLNIIDHATLSTECFYFYTSNDVKGLSIERNHISCGTNNRGIYVFSDDANADVFNLWKIKGNTFDNGLFGIQFNCGTSDQITNIEISDNVFVATTIQLIRITKVPTLTGKITHNNSVNSQKIYFDLQQGKLLYYKNNFQVENKDPALWLVEPFGVNKNVRTYAAAAPTTNTWAVGDICDNITPSEQGTAGSKYVINGWICITAGTPGTWVPSRTLTGN